MYKLDFIIGSIGLIIRLDEIKSNMIYWSNDKKQTYVLCKTNLHVHIRKSHHL